MNRLEVVYPSLRGYADEPTTATVKVVSFARGARLRRAATALAVSWLLAAATMLIPVAHLFLVPGLLVAGIVLFVKRSRARQVVQSATGTCPDCGAEQTLDLSGRWTLPQELACRECQRRLVLNAGGSEAPGH